jgi:hypothetical protein
MTPDRNQSGDETDDTYLFVVSYDDDAERKRVEYLFNNWDEGDVEKPDGLVRIASDVDHDDLYEKVVSKVPSDQVESFKLEPIEADVDRERQTIEQEINAPVDAVESFVEYIFSKKKAVLQSATHNEYEVYTKKGRANASYSLTEDGGATTVSVTVDGYPPAPSFLAEFFETELAEYAASQQ